jgi:hypothetical protein
MNIEHKFTLYYYLLIADPWITQNTKGNRYENAFFGFSVEKPKGWYSASPQEMNILVKAAQSVFEANKDELAKIVPNWSEDGTLPLFVFSKFSFTKVNDKSNHNIMAMAENNTAYSGFKTGCDFFNITKLIYKKILNYMRFLGKCRDVDINGQTFQTQNIRMKLPGIPTTVKQTVYVKLMKQDYIAIFILSYTDHRGKVELDKIMASLKIV